MKTNKEIAKALVGRGMTLEGQGKFKRAITLFDDVVHRFGDNDSPDIRKYIAMALFNKGAALGEQGKAEEKIALYDEIARRFGKDTSPRVREHIAIAQTLREELAKTKN